MQKKVTNAKRKNKKAPVKGASKAVKKSGQGIFNYDLETSEDISRKKMLNSKKIKNAKKKSQEDMFIGAKEMPKVNMKKIHNKNQEDIFLGAKEPPKVNKKKLNKAKKKNQEDVFIGAKEPPKVNKKKLNKAKKINQEDVFIGAEETPKISKKKLNKIKKQKKKEKIKRNKEIRKQEKKLEKQRQKLARKQDAKQIEKVKKVKKISMIAFIIILIIVGITLFLLSPVFKITKIEVKGNEKISTDEIISLSRVEKDSNLFRMSKREVTKNIKENSYIESVVINRIMPGTVEISIKERTVEFLIEYGGSYVYVDNNGYFLDISTENIADKLKIKGYKTSEEEIQQVGGRLCKEDLASMNDVRTILNYAENYDLKEKITSIDISDESNYLLYLESEKKTVHLGNLDNLDIKMLYLQSIIERDKDKEGLVFLNVDYRQKYPYGRYSF